MGAAYQRNGVCDEIEEIIKQAKYMKAIINPVDKVELERELTKDRFVRKTNNANNEIYIINYDNSPMVMREIGRLRELSFRMAGGGTGEEMDIDHYDTDKNHPYEQLIVWSPEDKEIIGGYRYINCRQICEDSSCDVNYLATKHLFHFSDKFVKDVMPYTIELGRSFVQPFYQSISNSRKGMFSLDNLWDGLGALIVNNPEIKFFFGKVTMYRHFNIKARDLILYFLKKHFPDPDKLLTPIHALEFVTTQEELDQIFNEPAFSDDYKNLIRNVRQLNENVPPLINAYMNLSPTMRTFGTAINDEFGDVEETGILVNINDIYQIKKERHISTYIKIA